MEESRRLIMLRRLHATGSNVGSFHPSRLGRIGRVDCVRAAFQRCTRCRNMLFRCGLQIATLCSSRAHESLSGTLGVFNVRLSGLFRVLDMRVRCFGHGVVDAPCGSALLRCQIVVGLHRLIRSRILVCAPITASSAESEITIFDGI